MATRENNAMIGYRKLTLGLGFLIVSAIIGLNVPDVAAIIITATGGGLFGVIYGNIREAAMRNGGQK